MQNMGTQSLNNNNNNTIIKTKYTHNPYSATSTMGMALCSPTSYKNNTNKTATTISNNADNNNKRYSLNSASSGNQSGSGSLSSYPFVGDLTNNNNNNNNHQQNTTNNNSATISPMNNSLHLHSREMLASSLAAASLNPNLHEATLHRSLIGSVSFVPYPTEAIDFKFIHSSSSQSSSKNASHANVLSVLDDESISNNSSDHHSNTSSSTNHNNKNHVRLFIGQLPYRVTEMQLQWMFYVFGNGAQLHQPERITRKPKSPGHPRVPTGCLHAHINENDLTKVIEGMDKRLLVDDTGVFFAQTDAEKLALDNYVKYLKATPEARFPDRPCDSVVVQEAVSSFQSKNPRWLTNSPDQERLNASSSSNNNTNHNVTNSNTRRGRHGNNKNYNNNNNNQNNNSYNNTQQYYYDNQQQQQQQQPHQYSYHPASYQQQQQQQYTPSVNYVAEGPYSSFSYY